MGEVQLRVYLLTLCLAVGRTSSLSGLPNNGLKTKSVLPRGRTESNAIQTPVFVEQPSNQYAHKKSSAVLHCSASHAAKLVFLCQETNLGNEAVEQLGLQNPTSIELVVQRRHLKGVGMVKCYCQATGNDGSKINSSTASVTLAYIRRNVKVRPLLHLVEQEKNSTVSLDCTAQGVPSPSVSWMKDGVPLIPSRDGRISVKYKPEQASLVITNALLSDVGNYTCTAKNIADQVQSPAVFVKIYVHGGWSEWTETGNCSVNCGSGTQFMQRSCTNPAPQNGGNMCVGEHSKEVPCHIACPVALSSGVRVTCPKDISVYADNQTGQANVSWPEPVITGNTSGGGNASLITVKVTPSWAVPPVKLNFSEQDYIVKYSVLHNQSLVHSCEFSVNVDLVKRPPPTKSSDLSSDIAKLPVIILSAAVAGLIVICFIVITILARSRKRMTQQFNQKKGGQAERLNQNTPTSHSQLDFPVITHSVSYEEAVRPCNELKCPPPVSTVTVNPVLSELKLKLTPPTAFVEEEKYELKHKPVKRTDSNVSKQSTASEVSRMMWDIAQLPEHADPKFAAYGLIDHNGGKLTIPDSDVTLTVPRMAIPKGKTEAIYIALMKQDGLYPSLSAKQALLSPVVICGPNGLKFDRPVILTMPHAALLNDGAWKLQVQCNEKDLEDPPEWKQLVDVNKEDPSQAEFVLMEPRSCHLMVDHFTVYALVGESVVGRSADRLVQLVGFATPPSRDSDCVVRVYCVAGTPDAVQAVREQESQLYGETCDAPKPMYFKDGGGNLKVRLRTKKDGWQVETAEKEIRFNHIWNGIERMPSATFVFSRQKGADVSQFSCSFDAKQECPDGDEQEVNVVTSAKNPVSSTAKTSTKTENQKSPQDSTASNSGLEAARASPVFAGSAPGPRFSSPQSNTDDTAVVTFVPSPLFSPISSRHFSFASSGYYSLGYESLTSPLSLPEKTRMDLMLLLDPEHPRADWRQLAERFGCEPRLIRWLEHRKESPTLSLLNWLETWPSPMMPMGQMAKVLKDLGRVDAAEVVEGALSRELETLRESDV